MLREDLADLSVVGWRSMQAFTLPELLITVAVVGLLSAVSVSMMNVTSQGYRARTSAWQLAADLRLARQNAVSTTCRHRVCFINCGAPVPENGYLIQRQEGARWEIQSAVEPSSKDLLLGSNATITFSETGEASPGTVTLSSGTASFQVRTHFTGKVTVCRSACP